MSIFPDPILQPNRHNTTESTPLLPSENEDHLHAPEEGEVTTLTMFQEEFCAITRYALPVASSSLLDFTRGFVSVIFIGHLSTTMLAAAGLASVTADITGYSILRGLSSSLDTLLPSAYTSAHPQLVGLWAQRTAVVIALATLPMSLIWIKAESVLLALKQDPEVAHLAAIYLRWSTLSLPASVFNSISRHYFQSQGFFFVQVRIVCIAAPFHILLNYALVWGVGPIRLGFIGVPVADALSSYVVTVASLVHGVYLIPRTAWHPLSPKMFTNLGLITRLSLAGIAQVASESWAWTLFGFAASFMGPVALASHSIISTTSTMSYLVSSHSIASAALTRIGNLVGEKLAGRARAAANTSLLVSLSASVFTSAMLLFGRHSLAKLFTRDPAVISLFASVIPLIALLQFLQGNSTLTAGILRVRGKQYIGALLNSSAYYIIGLPVGVWLASRWNMGLHGLWIGKLLSLMYCSVIGTIICFRTDWGQEVSKVLERLSEEERLRRMD